jgi:hypothetical protein
VNDIEYYFLYYLYVENHEDGEPLSFREFVDSLDLNEEYEE